MFWNDEYQNKLDELIEQNERGTIEGIHEDLPIELYHHPLCPGFSKSDLDKASQSFEHLSAYKARRLLELKDPQKTDSRAMIIGSAFHDSLFTPGRFVDLYSTEPEVPEGINRRTKEGKLQYQTWEQEILLPFQKSKIGLSTDELQMIASMKQKADHHELFQSIVQDSKKEITIFFRDPETGILLKCRPDVMNEKVLICLDAKTTGDARPTEFRRTIAVYSYDKQAALQIDGIKAVTGKTFDFVFSAHEKTDPFAIALYRVDEAVLDVGRALYRRDLRYIHGAMSGAASKSYPTDIVSIGLPAWAFDINSR